MLLFSPLSVLLMKRLQHADLTQPCFIYPLHAHPASSLCTRPTEKKWQWMQTMMIFSATFVVKQTLPQPKSWLVIAGKAQVLLITSVVAPFHWGVHVSHASEPACIEAELAHLIRNVVTMINVICYTCALQMKMSRLRKVYDPTFHTVGLQTYRWMNNIFGLQHTMKYFQCSDICCHWKSAVFSVKTGKHPWHFIILA